MKKYYCENCGKEHDGSYGSGRFCSDHCRRAYSAKQVKHKVNNLPPDKTRAKPEGWKCSYCELVFRTRREKQAHVKEAHPNMGGTSWNKGLTKETNNIIKKAAKTLKEKYIAGKIIPTWKGKHLSEETCKKISEGRKKFLRENPDKHPYILYSHKKGKSPAEKYIESWLINENIQYESEYWESPYHLDFKINNIDLEVDGNFHYSDPKKVQADLNRDNYLKSKGYKIFRINWKEYNNFDKDQRINYLLNLKKYILNNSIL